MRDRFVCVFAAVGASDMTDKAFGVGDKMRRMGVAVAPSFDQHRTFYHWVVVAVELDRVVVVLVQEDSVVIASVVQRFVEVALAQ